MIPKQPTKLKEVADAFRKYGVPPVQTYTQDQILIGNALLNLALPVLRSKLAAEKAGLPTNILNTAVQLSVTAI